MRYRRLGTRESRNRRGTTPRPPLSLRLTSCRHSPIPVLARWLKETRRMRPVRESLFGVYANEDEVFQGIDHSLRRIGQNPRDERVTWVCPNLNYPSPRTGISNSGYSIAARYEERRSHRWYRHVPAGISLIIIRLSTVQIRDIRRPRNARACVPTLLPLSYRERRPSSWRP